MLQQQRQQQEVPTSRNEAYEFNTLMITTTNTTNPAYEEIRGNRAGAINM